MSLVYPFTIHFLGWARIFFLLHMEAAWILNFLMMMIGGSLIVFVTVASNVVSSFPTAAMNLMILIVHGLPLAYGIYPCESFDFWKVAAAVGFCVVCNGLKGM
ncbi:hypothetical protein NE237_003073 [Protea cynaroides]|uniref:Uncharacterized protein n=1 Tax=Protea cynaroides TaxID=273540 RepID=A0A9Q0QSD9_9MAGN|nr:hypothetical protein NE237_003073 [Protea cynaroides]